jgi:hypothetical protein
VFLTAEQFSNPFRCTEQTGVPGRAPMRGRL